jgi:hypothetical protein
MSDTIGRITVPEIAPSGTFPLVTKYPHGAAQEFTVVAHQFGSANAKIVQRFLVGSPAKRYTFRGSLTFSQRDALADFWTARKGAYEPFTYSAPNADGTFTDRTVIFENAPLSLEQATNAITETGLTFIELPDPDDAPTYAVSETCSRFPSAALKAGLLTQVQELIPLVRIRVTEPAGPGGVPDIYLSDRRCTVDGQLYLPRLLELPEVGQTLVTGAQGQTASDEVQFVFGNADGVMRDLANDTDLRKARIEFSLYHVATGILLNLWAGEVIDWLLEGDGSQFVMRASDGIYEVNLPYPTRRCSRNCWKPYNDGVTCPYATQGSLDLVNFPNASADSCDRGFHTDNGCRAHSMNAYFGGIPIFTQSVGLKQKSAWGLISRAITSTSQIGENVFGEALPEIWHHDGNDAKKALPVNCLLVAGREEDQFYAGLGIVGAGPISRYTTPQMVDWDDDGTAEKFVGHTLDGQPHHGYGTAQPTYGLRRSYGHDPAQDNDPDANSQKFAIDSLGVITRLEQAAGVAFLQIRRTDAKGIQPTKVTDHQMVAMVSEGLSGYTWAGEPPVRSLTSGLTNPVWIAINCLIRALGLWNATAEQQEALFDVNAAVAAAAIADTSVAKIIGSGSETQFAFRGTISETKPLRDWLTDILSCGLGYYTWAFGKLKLGVRINSSVVEAFTAGNILMNSLRLSPIKPGFEKLVVHYADEEYQFAANTVEYCDFDHAAKNGRSAAPITAEMNLPGVSTKSQAARIAITRTREELGGITEAEWLAAREIAFKTTVLALNTEPGMVCSLTDASMPGGAGEFRVTGWRLNKDYSIDITGRTTTDSMYDYAIGPKPADIVADPIPAERNLEPIARNIGDVTAGTPAAIDDAGVLKAQILITTTAPVDLGVGDGLFAGVQLHIGNGGIVTPAERFAYTGDAGEEWQFTVSVPYPVVGATVRLWFPSYSEKYQNAVTAATPYVDVVLPAYSVAVMPALPASVTLTEVSRHKGQDGLTHVVIEVTATLPANHRAIGTEFWLSKDGGSTKGFPESPEGYLGKVFGASGQFEVLLGDEDGDYQAANYSWVAYATTWNNQGSYGVDDAVASDPVAITAYAALPANLITDFQVTKVEGYRDSEGAPFWGWTATWTQPTNATWFSTELTRQWVNAAGEADPNHGEVLVTHSTEPGTVTIKQPQNWEYPAADSAYNRCRFRLYCTTGRLEASGVPGVHGTKQTTVNGVTEYVELTLTTPAGRLDPTRLRPERKSPGSLVTNHRFTAGLSGWEASSGTLGVGLGADGGDCGVMTPGQMFYQVIGVAAPGDVFTLECDHKFASGSGGNVRLAMAFRKKDGGYAGGAATLVPASTETWTKFTVRAVAPALTAYAYIHILFDVEPAGTAYIDNVIVRQEASTPPTPSGCSVTVEDAAASEYGIPRYQLKFAWPAISAAGRALIAGIRCSVLWDGWTERSDFGGLVPPDKTSWVFGSWDRPAVATSGTAYIEYVGKDNNVGSSWSGAFTVEPSGATTLKATKIDPATVGYGVGPDSSGRLALRNRNNSNIIQDFDFASGLITAPFGASQWWCAGGTGEVIADAGSTQGGYVFHPTANGAYCLQDLAIRPGQKLNLTARVYTAAGTDGTIRLKVEWYNKAGDYISATTVQDTTGPKTAGATLTGVATAPANANTARVEVLLVSGWSTGNWYVDFVEGHLVQVAADLRLGATMGDDGAGNIIPYGMRPVAGLPSLPSAYYPAGTCIHNILDHRYYRTENGSVWVATEDPTKMVNGALASGVTLAASQITAGTLIVGVQYAGKINATQVNAGTFTGFSLICTANSTTTSINNAYDGAGYGISCVNETNDDTAWLSPGRVAIGLVDDPIGVGRFVTQPYSGNQYALLVVENSLDTKYISLSGRYATVFAGEADTGKSVLLDGPNSKITIDGTQVLGTRKTGWTAASGTASRATFDTATVTTEQLAQRFKALEDDLISHGLIGT